MADLYEGGVCEFDGRLALVAFKGELLLFVRANLAAAGRRHVQVTRMRAAEADGVLDMDNGTAARRGWRSRWPSARSSARGSGAHDEADREQDRLDGRNAGHSRDGTRWAPFKTVHLGGYDATGDVYFFAAQVNPAHNGSLVAIFPLVHRLRACLAIAASYDGVHWSRVTPLLSCRL